MMTNYKAKDYRVFEMFSEQWALVTAGTMERFNSCTLGWGSLGTYGDTTAKHALS